MKRLILVAGLFVTPCLPQSNQIPIPTAPGHREDTRLPNGKSQIDAVVKSDYEKNVKDAAALVELAQSLKADIDKEGEHVLSIASVKKTEEIEKLSRRIRARMRSY